MTLQVSFRSTEGVPLGTDVSLAGVKIGLVTDLALDTETSRTRTEMIVAADVPIPDDSSAVVTSEGLLGSDCIEMVPDGSLTALAGGGEILDTQGTVNLLQFLLRYLGGGEEEGA